MKIPSSSSSSLAPEHAPVGLSRSPSPLLRSDATQAAQRRHHGSADFLRRLSGPPPATAVAPAAGPSQATALTALVDALCDAIQGSHPQENLNSLLPAGWYDAPHQPDAEVTLRHAWPFTAGECRVTAARMVHDAKDQRLQQLSLDLAEPLDLGVMQQQFGQAQARPAYQDGGPGDVLHSWEQEWGRLSVIANATGTVARTLLLEPRATPAQ